ncbi:AI-2 transport protein TqsA [Rhodobacteraceae bacterium THAF1]|uniref:AI-2E family transporter n=1 Tax=Palleronia sp. THAF1 TaxID=2587842 RepID=UPI000F3F3CAB|nr:AI-2E family transporter [Palleronia sp. THAF1]QFU08442.1 AI-2 transport protein TqsA [Palleronia sp. THAF1]VDC29303.1 AI-2 transport protein TqsA [Rhodobacteraceae bacterium THAF1]
METEQTKRLRGAAHISLVIGGIVITCWALYIAEFVFAPTVLALVFGVVLSPLSDTCERLGVPRFLSALIGLILTLLLIVVVASLALPAVIRLIEAWPVILEETRAFIYGFQATLQGIESAGQEVQEAIGAAEGASGEEGDSGESGGMSLPSTTDALFLAPSVLGQTITFAGVLFFFLLGRSEIYAWLAQHVAPVGREKETARRLKLAEREVARYFLTITLVNLGFGICVVIAMTLVGVPSALLWGLATALLNFVLYLGPAIVFCALMLTGMVMFDGGYSVVPALVFLMLNMVEAQFVTPSAIGRTMQVNPLLVFLALVFFLWLWGPIGGFVAIPLLLWALTLTREISNTRRDLRDEVDAAS